MASIDACKSIIIYIVDIYTYKYILHQRRPQILGSVDSMTGCRVWRQGMQINNLWSYIFMVLWSYGRVVLWSDGHMVLWSYGLMVLWSDVLMVLCSYALMVSWSHGLWSYGLMVLWSYLLMVAPAQSTFRERWYLFAIISEKLIGDRCTGSESYVHILFTLCLLFVRFLFTLGAH